MSDSNYQFEQGPRETGGVQEIIGSTEAFINTVQALCMQHKEPYVNGYPRMLDRAIFSEESRGWLRKRPLSSGLVVLANFGEKDLPFSDAPEASVAALWNARVYEKFTISPAYVPGIFVARETLYVQPETYIPRIQSVFTGRGISARNSGFITYRFATQKDVIEATELIHKSITQDDERGLSAETEWSPDAA